jgi:hypothetical protein
MKTLLPLIFFLFLLSYFGYAQESALHFMYESNKFIVQQSGYHKIELNEQIINHLNASLGNIKLYDEKNKEIKHYLQTSIPINTSVKRHHFPFYQTETKLGRSTELVVENIAKESIDYFVLYCKPFSSTKTLTISGSDDHEQWVKLVETHQIHYTNIPIDITTAQRSEFRFYKIEIDDFDTEPISISKIMAETSLFPKESYVLLQQPFLQQQTTLIDKDSITYIDFNFTDRQYINWLDFQFIANMPTYSVNVELQAKKDSSDFFEHIQSFQLANGKPNYLIINKLYGQYFRLKIHNYKTHTAQRLKFENIKAYQLKYNLIANVVKGKSYQLRFGGEHHISSNNLSNGLSISPINPEINFQISDTLEIIYPNSFNKVAAANVNNNFMNNSFMNENSEILWFGWAIIGVAILSCVAIFWVFAKKLNNSEKKLQLTHKSKKSF